MMKKTINPTSEHLYISGVDATWLADTYGTPLYVMDESLIRKQCKAFKSSFSHPSVQTEVIYASKAFLTLSMAKLINQEGLSMDVVSGGELYTAIKSGFPMERIFFHGNNKSEEEIRMAINHHVGTIVIDNEDEWDLLSHMSFQGKRRLMLRINPGIEAHTHEYIKTTKNDSKFGLSVYDPKTLEVIEKIYRHPQFECVGFHTHIGSQIFETESFMELAKSMMEYASIVYKKIGMKVREINLGGGFGARYTQADTPFDIFACFPQLLSLMVDEANRLNLEIPKVLIEPGRSIVAEAGYTLYRVGGTKKTFGGKHFIFVDGSMADHIRTALYQATYQAVIASDLSRKGCETYTVTGKACESGDIIIREAKLPPVFKGDLLAVLTTGAYHYTMSSNYNRLLKPAVVFVSEGTSRLVVKRETYDDLIRNDLE